MQIHGVSVKQTPIFRVDTQQIDPFKQVYGSIFHGENWTFPAYWPLGEKAVRDLHRLTVEHSLSWSESSLLFLQDLRKAATSWDTALTAYKREERIVLPVDDDFFHGYLPYAHQRLGIVRAYHAYRAYYLWEMGVGKTKTIIDSLRILRREGRFKRAIIIGPPVVIPTWIREIERCTRGDLSYAIWGERHFNPQADLILTTYGKVRTSKEGALQAREDLARGLEQFNALRAIKHKRPYTKEEYDKKIQSKLNLMLDYLDFDTLVIDESHYMGSHFSQQTKAVLNLVQGGKAARRFLLTGTAADNPRKLYPQLYCLSPALLSMDYRRFENRYIEKSPDPKKHFLVLGYKHLNELNAVVDEVATRMRKEECLDLPPFTITDIPFRMSNTQVDEYNNIVAEVIPALKTLLEEHGFTLEGLVKDEDGLYVLPPELSQYFHIPHVAALLNKLLQMISGFMIHAPSVTICDTCVYMNVCVPADIKPYTKLCKVQPKRPETRIVRCEVNPKRQLFKELTERILETNKNSKMIAWGVYLPELDDMEAVAKELKVGYVRIDGKSSKYIRVFEDQFREDPACRLWISQVAAGIGINLVSANYTIYYSLPWSLLQYEQSMERNNRPGQTRAMTAYRLLTTRALDQNVRIALEHKVKIARTLLDEVECSSCDDLPRCQKEGNRPFESGCKYQTHALRPIAKASLIPVENLTQKAQSVMHRLWGAED